MEDKFSNDKVLIAALAEGNEKAFNFLISSYYEKLCVYATTLCHNQDQAEDIVQNVFFRLWENRSSLNNSKRLNSFLYRAVYNEFIDQYRQSKKVMTLEKKHIDAISAILEEESNSDIDRLIRIVNSEIDNLPRKCKKTFLLSKKEGLTNFEIAEYLKISVKSVEAHITKAYKILREKINENSKNRKGSKHFLLFLFLS